MIYSDLFTRNPIESVIQIDKADKKNEAQNLVERFVITPSLGDAIETVALPQLDFESGAEGKGIFVVGSYGTGKSHVMSFLSVIAEDAGMLPFIKNDEWKPKLERFASSNKKSRCHSNRPPRATGGQVGQHGFYVRGRRFSLRLLARHVHIVKEIGPTARHIGQHGEGGELPARTHRPWGKYITA